jgi:hypothetical protein
MNEQEKQKMSLLEIIEAKDKLTIYVNSEIQNFIETTGIYPKIKIEELEMSMRCGTYKTMQIKFTIEL